MKHALCAALAALPLTAAAVDPVARYPFETEDTGTSPEVIVNSDVAIFGTGGSLAHNSRKLGTGSLRMRGDFVVNASPEGDDGAISSNNYDWSSGDTRTIAFWMRANVAQTDPLATMISLGNTLTNGARFDIRLNTGAGTSAATPPGADGLLRLEVQGGFIECTAADFTAAGLTTLRDSAWHHVAVVVPTATATVHTALFYIDGTLVSHSSQGANQAINTASGPLRLGDSYQDNARDFNGYLDEVRVYNIALTAQEITALYQDDMAHASAIAAFDGAPEILGTGDTSNLSWVTTGATAISIDQGIGTMTGQTSTVVTPTTIGKTTYTLSVTTAAGVETAPLDITLLGPVMLTNAALAVNGFSTTASNLVPGKAYEFVSSTTLAPDSWSLVTAFTGPATTTRILNDAAASVAAAPAKYYRVKLAGE